MPQRNLKLEIQKEFQKVANSKFLTELTKQLNHYEKRVRGLVREFNIRGQEARQKSKRQIDDFSKRLQRTRREVEKTLKSLIDQESKLLNKSFNELVVNLKGLSEQEKSAAAKKGKGKGRGRKPAAKKSRLKTLKTIHEEHKDSGEPATAPALVGEPTNVPV